LCALGRLDVSVDLRQTKRGNEAVDARSSAKQIAGSAAQNPRAALTADTFARASIAYQYPRVTIRARKFLRVEPDARRRLADVERHVSRAGFAREPCGTKTAIRARAEDCGGGPMAG
jgi:hypothetical protein